MRVAAVLCDALARAGCEPVLVGGAAVEIYTRAGYVTADFDFLAASGSALDKTMRQLGFSRVGRQWSDESLAIVVAFPGSRLAPARSASMRVEELTLTVIAVEDLIVDRLASCARGAGWVWTGRSRSARRTWRRTRRCRSAWRASGRGCRRWSSPAAWG